MSKIFLFMTAGFTLLFMACSSSSPQPQSSSSDDLLTNITFFVEAVHEGNFDKALGYLDPEEAARMRGSDGVLSEDYKRRLLALRLSTLANRSSVKLGKGNKIIGIYDQLPDALAPDPSRRQIIDPNSESQIDAEAGQGDEYPIPDFAPSDL